MNVDHGLDPTVWFERAMDSGRAKRSTAGPLNITAEAGRLEVEAVHLVESDKSVELDISWGEKKKKYKLASRYDIEDTEQ